MRDSEDFQTLRAELVNEGCNVAQEKRSYKPRDKTAKAPTEQTPPIEIFDAATIQEIVAAPFDLYAARSGREHWRLSPQEREKIGLLVNRVASKHLPDWLAQYGDELSLGIVVLVAIQIRLKVDSDIKVREEEETVLREIEVPSA